jgi:hypothetical protein
MEDSIMATFRRVTPPNVVWGISEYAISDDEVVAAAASLINSSKVLLCGFFAGARIDLSVPTGVAPPSTTIINGLASGSRPYRHHNGLRL